MATAEGAGQRPAIVLNYFINLAAVLIAFSLGTLALLSSGALDPALHTILDTSVMLISALVALLLWDISRRTDHPWPLFLSMTFTMLAAGELLHVIAVLGWIGEGGQDDVRLRAGSWGPPAHLLPIGLAAAVLASGRSRSFAPIFAVGLVLLAAGLVAIFLSIPRYTPPWIFGITRPSLLLVPFLWVAVGAMHWRRRAPSRIAQTIALTAIPLVLAHIAILYSRAPSDPAAMVAHLGKFLSGLLMLFNLTQIGAADSARRREVEIELTALNSKLDARVLAGEAEQRRSQALIETIFEASPAVIYVKDLAGRYLMVNRRYCEIFKLEPGEAIGKTDHELFSQVAADAFCEMDRRVVEANHPLIEEESVPLGDGRHIYLSVKAPLRDAANEVYAVFGISTDVTERRRTEEALKASEERNRLVIETAIDSVVTIDANGIITGWNGQAERTFGWTQAEALGRAVEQVLMPERYREAHRQGLLRYLETGEARVLGRRIELDGLRRDGREFPVELSIAPFHTGDAISFTAFVRDITERKLADARLKSQVSRLHLLEQITRAVDERHDVQSIFQVVVRTLEDQLPADFVCICLYDRAKHSLRVAHVGAGSLNLSGGLGMTERAEIAIDGNGLSQCVAGNLVYEPDISSIDYPFSARLVGHGLRSLIIASLQFEREVFGALIVARRAPDAFPSADCEFLRQLSEHVGLAAHQAHLRNSLQRAYDDLRHSQEAVIEQERLRAIGQMASGIAHDINNAISPVAVYTQSLVERQRELAVSSEIQEYLEIVGRVVKDVSATVARLREFYRPHADNEFEAVDLNALVPQVVELTRARWSDMPQLRGVVVTVSTQLEADLPPIMGDAAELREALTNLVFNAVDAMPEGGAITVRTLTAGHKTGYASFVRLEVGDTGSGMDKVTRERCLEPFFTTKGERGTGLGLAMVQNTAQRHKAELEIHSAPGIGTRIGLNFSAIRSRRAAPKQKRTEQKRPALNLLLIDDDPTVLRSTQLVLKLKGHNVTPADGGRAGIDALHAAQERGEAFDLVISDLGMPYVDGNQVAQASKELFPDMPVALLTGWGRRLGTDDRSPTNVDFVLAKPLDFSDLNEVFDQIHRAY